MHKQKILKLIFLVIINTLKHSCYHYIYEIKGRVDSFLPRFNLEQVFYNFLNHVEKRKMISNNNTDIL